MVKNHSLLRLIHRLSQHTGVWILAICWLLLNAQFAVASHDCRMADPSAPAQALHTQHIQPASINLSAEIPGPLCEKHCLPEATQADTGNHAFVALIPETSLLLAYEVELAKNSSFHCLTPPIQEIAAEIRFCRFRE